MTAVGVSDRTRELLGQPRWVYGDSNPWALARACPFCASFGGNGGRHMPHEPAACLLCGSVQCSNDSRCRVCSFGWMPGWSRSDHSCGYAGCAELAVAVVPGKKRACLAHAQRKVGAEVTAALAHRDSGAGWQRWTFTAARAAW